MDKDLAREVVRAAFRSGRELEKLLSVLKDRCSPDDYEVWKRQIAKAIDGINVALLDKALSQFPELEAEIKVNLARTGRAMP